MTLPDELSSKADVSNEIIASLEQQGWEAVQVGNTGEGRAKITGTYTFGPDPGDKAVEDMLRHPHIPGRRSG